MKLTNKQKEVFIDSITKQPKTLLLHGAIRTGKTFILSLLFYDYIRQFEGQGKLFLMIGYTIGTLKTNVLSIWKDVLDVEVDIKQDNTFKLYGNTVKIAEAQHAGSYKKIWGLTAQGALGNEVTKWHETTFYTMFERCSEDKARLFLDTNPDNPEHFVKKFLLDNPPKILGSGRLDVLSYHFELKDNSKERGGYLSDEYIEDLVLKTPKGFRYNRNIDGKWTSAENAVFTEFSTENIIKEQDIPAWFNRELTGLDFGFTHNNVHLFIGELNNKYYVFHEMVGNKKLNEQWIEEFKSYPHSRKTSVIWSDEARADLIREYQDAGLPAAPAKKDVMPSIDLLQVLFKQKALFISEKCVNLIRELYKYERVVKDEKEVIKKANDDCVDALRYPIYNDYNKYRYHKSNNRQIQVETDKYGGY